MNLLKGGRGKKAPWDSTHLRVPEPIREHIQSIIDDWKTSQLTGEDKSPKIPLTSFEVELIAKDILKQKKSARVSVQKLLTELGYHVDL